MRLQPSRLKNGILLMAAVGMGVSLAACSNRSPEKRPLSELAISGAKSSVRNDADMQKVLNQYARFDPKAIEKITPTEARQQPTVADAVKAVLEKGRARQCA